MAEDLQFRVSLALAIADGMLQDPHALSKAAGGELG
jgi:hypothetical protein